jgi:hypothetical protein
VGEGGAAMRSAIVTHSHCQQQCTNTVRRKYQSWQAPFAKCSASPSHRHHPSMVQVESRATHSPVQSLTVQRATSHCQSAPMLILACMSSLPPMSDFSTSLGSTYVLHQRPLGAGAILVTQAQSRETQSTYSSHPESKACCYYIIALPPAPPSAWSQMPPLTNC